MNELQMIADFSNAFGPSGFEDDVLAVARRYAPQDARIEEDSLRNLYIYRKANTGGKPIIQLDAHSDELGFMVQAIRPNGTLKFLPLGSWVNSNIPAHKVRVRARDGSLISGITTAKPPHFMTDAEKNRMPALEEMAIDVGASSPEEAREAYGIRIAAPAAPDVTFEYDEKHDIMIGKAFDNRLGCAAIQATLAALNDEALAVDVVGAMASQEEMNCRGAVVTARRVKPQIAIVFEGSPADDTGVEPWLSQTALRKGPMLRHIDSRMITNPRFQRWALDLAEELGIPAQEAVRSGGATNGAPIHLSGLGIPCIVIGMPVRYIHSHYGIACLSDFRSGVRLATEIIRRMNEDIIRSF
ncbi:MAG: M42 family peptidase [Clostridia bacterium]|nr:M42 family peptidase [Clostridia bacterium]MBR4443116.1 M42 family peptidase [Clostridia bacterium]